MPHHWRATLYGSTPLTPPPTPASHCRSRRATAAAARNPIPWPSGKAPVPAPLQHAPNPNTKLPQCDYVIVTWTVEEARCLADTLTPGFASSSAWYHYTHNYASTFVPLIRPGAPALTSKRLASWFPTVINGKRVLCMKSELHFSQDGAKIPVALLWQQIIAETRCKLIITTGTAGGVGGGIGTRRRGRRAIRPVRLHGLIQVRNVSRQCL